MLAGEYNKFEKFYNDARRPEEEREEWQKARRQGLEPVFGIENDAFSRAFRSKDGYDVVRRYRYVDGEGKHSAPAKVERDWVLDGKDGRMYEYLEEEKRWSVIKDEKYAEEVRRMMEREKR